MAALPTRPLTAREVLDLPYALLQENFRRLGRALGVGILAINVLVGVLVAVVPSEAAGWIVTITLLTACWLLQIVLAALLLGPVSRSGPTIAALQLPRLILPALICAAIASDGHPLLILAIVGTVLCHWCVPPRMVPAAVIAAVENLPIRAARRRSAQLIAGSLSRIWLLWPVANLTIILSMLMPMWFAIRAANAAASHGWNGEKLIIVSTAVTFVAGWWALVETATRVAVFTDLRCRREGFDLRQALTAMDSR